MMDFVAAEEGAASPDRGDSTISRAKANGDGADCGWPNAAAIGSNDAGGRDVWAGKFVCATISDTGIGIGAAMALAGIGVLVGIPAAGEIDATWAAISVSSSFVNAATTISPSVVSVVSSTTPLTKALTRPTGPPYNVPPASLAPGEISSPVRLR